MALVGVPKAIDNDIQMMVKTFGFDTAVEEAQHEINSAYIEVHVSCSSTACLPCSLLILRSFINLVLYLYEF